MKKLVLLFALLSTSAHAQSVRQSGNITPGHVASWVTTGVIADGGPASGTVIVGATTQNDFVCFNGSGSLIDCGLSATGTNNWTGLQNFNGGATAPTRTALDSTTNVATTQFVTSAAITILSTPNTWTALQTFNAGIAGTNQQFVNGIAAAPAATGASQRPANLFNCSSDNVATTNIECQMNFYSFGGSSMTGSRFAGYDFIFNTAATAAGNTNRNYVGRYAAAFTSVGDGGTGSGDLRGGWAGSNFVCQLFTGAGAFNQYCAAQELDTSIATGTAANYVWNLNLVASNAVRGTTIDAQLVFGGSNIGLPAAQAHIGSGYLMLVSDVNSPASPHIDPTYSGSVLFGSKWLINPSTPRSVTDGFDLTGFTFSGSAFKSAFFSVDGTGAVTTSSYTSSGAMVILNTTAPSSIPGGSAGFGYRFSSTALFGTFFGSGAPSLSAAQGSLYLRSDGLPYYNTNGTTGWGSLAPLASPTFTGTVTFANLAAVGLLASVTAPVIGACGGGSPAIAAHNGTAAFRVTGGSGNSTCAITLPSAPTGWNCYAVNLTTQSATVFVLKQTASSQTSATLTNFNTSGAAANFVNGDTFAVSCFAL